ncbi:hypothetical protein JW752_03755 [Candidatus Peregrinibacteria bacterium]|nr:hypothetical protein [Candidatus Peregrinibacteria bacterium]
MKKISIIISGLLSLLLLAGCGEKLPDFEDRVVEDGQTAYTGIIEPIEINIYQDGTHKIITGDGDVIIQSSKVNLNHYADKKVTVFGSMQKLIDNKSEVFTVEKVQLEEAGGSGESMAYESKPFGFRFEYPDLWELLEDTDGLTLRSDGISWVTIDIFNTKTELDDFIASYEIEDGTPVTIGGQRSIRYIESREIRIYTRNASKGKVYKITFNQSQENNEAQKKLFYAFLESFNILVSQTKEGEKCGGEENLTCPDEYRCELESGDPDAEGICVPVDEVISDLDCPFIPTPSGCMNYEAVSFNKDGCPTSYKCLEDPEEDDTKSASDEITESSPQTEQASDAEGADTSQRSEGEAVVATFSKYQNKILPLDADVIQFEIVEKQNLLAVVYEMEDKRFRSVYSYEPSANEYNFNRLGYYEEGEDRDWVLTEGEEVRITSDKVIIKAGSAVPGAQVISSDMRLYENTHKDYSVQYPKDWYYRSFGSIENTVWTVGFAEESLDSIFDALIALRILDEPSAGKKEMKGDQYLIEVPRDEDSHFLLEGNLEFKEIMDAMAETIIQF